MTYLESVRRKLVPVSEVCEILSCSRNKALSMLGIPDGTKRLRNGQIGSLYEINKIKGIKENMARDKRCKDKTHKAIYSRASIDMVLNNEGELVPKIPDIGTRVCAVKDCNTRVEKDRYVCKKHRAEFKNRQRWEIDEYAMHL